MPFRRPMAWITGAVAALLAVVVAHHVPRPVAADPPEAPKPLAPAAPDEFTAKVVPFLDSYCYSCHNNKDNAGGVTLEGVETAVHAKKDRKTWEMVERVLMDGSMPPKKRKQQPSKEERTAVAAYLGGTLLKVSCVGPKDPGRVT